MKKGYKNNIEKLTEENNDFRRVLYTGEESQLVLMSLAVGEEIGEEVHNDNDQFFRFESGKGKVIINDTVYEVGDGDAVIVPKGAKHNVINVGETALKLYTIYSPAHHKDGTVHSTKAEALASEEEFDGITSE
jgi:mannose-6-phosphate isomerase-like protein (cupin superfamily)